MKQRKLPTEWKKANVVPAHNVGDKKILNNYRPVSLLPICGLIFKRLIYNNLFKYFIENDLLSQNQSVFKPGYSCINQLISITHEIYQSFDDGLKSEEFFWTYPKPLIKFGMKVLFIN